MKKWMIAFLSLSLSCVAPDRRNASRGSSRDTRVTSQNVREEQPAQKQEAAFAGRKSYGSTLSKEDIARLLYVHNQARKTVGVPPLAWSDELANYSQRWADHLAASGCRFEHRPESGEWRQLYGENLFMGTAGYYDVGDAVESWISEKQYYSGEPLHDGNWHASGHYTQVVWHSTTHVGCAQVLCNGEMILVCNYAPAGNVLGERAY